MDMTATTPNIEARIAAERKRLFDEQALQVELEKQRLIPLEAGNDDVLDEIEGKIARSIERAERIQERIALLEQRLQQSRGQDEATRLDELAAAADRARTAGSKILNTVYPKLARQLAQALAELKQHQQTIIDANRELNAAKRETIELADPQGHPITAPNVFGLGVVALHEVVNLPNEAVDSPAYWEQRNVANEFALSTLASPDMRNSRLLTP